MYIYIYYDVRAAPGMIILRVEFERIITEHNEMILEYNNGTHLLECYLLG